MNECSGRLDPHAIRGLQYFNQRRYFEAHEELEHAWRMESGPIRDLYRGILQVAVVYLHILRGNYTGAVKVYGRSKKWTSRWPGICRGIQVQKLREDLESVMQEVHRLGREKIASLDPAAFKNVEWTEESTWTCDRCGNRMFEHNCRIICTNCGNRFDCSDLNLYFN